ncbi:hypothetical protein FJT64_026534 [Amphibalanus amphitrite]|uniref:Apple domain-containing protein n=1 Tax=Amphibalanus amphitrite TaxID=1232801 RepID=A0A6A4WGE8_AMPAM|nr:hypothetical protein FJT64_026534 [Amphibalanus amphitrite]
METARSGGRLAASERLTAAATANSCACCALCHLQPRCASLGFNPLTGECELYGSVASYATLLVDPEENWSYFVMPGRSAHQQFCRHDSDCTEAGDACRGRVCTDRTSVTCRDIARWLGAGRHPFGDVDVRMFGWLGGRETPLECDVVDGVAGFTELLSVRAGVRLNSATILELNRRLEPDVRAHSILGMAEAISRLGAGPVYQLAVSVDGWWATDGQQGRVPRNHTITVETIGGTIQVSFRDERNAVTRVKLPSDDAAGAGYVAQLEQERSETRVAYDWIEIYIRE